MSGEAEETASLLETLRKEISDSTSGNWSLVVDAAKPLRDQGNQEAKQLLIEVLNTGDIKALRAIGDTLVSFGSSDLFPSALALFEHPDMFVASGARYGAMVAGKKGWAEEGFKLAVVKHCLELLQQPKPPGMYDPIRVIEALDPATLVSELSNPPYLTIGHPMLGPMVSALTRHGAAPSPQFLNAWLETLSQTSKDRLVAIRSLIKQGHPSAREYIEAGIKSPKGFDEDFLVGMWRARFQLAGIIPLSKSAMDAQESQQVPFGSLPEVFQNALLVEHVIFTINQERIDNFYTDPLGKFPNKTIKALASIGAVKHQKLFAELVKLYGKGPSGDQGEVLDYMETLDGRTQEKIEDLSDKLADLPNLELILLKWDWQRQGGK
jgi:hypothetical protein